ncbi:MAG: helix-turn-helix domain-containing protein [Chloroflexota bacterium]|nr:helix-turn-helix domain-containing protein [Chloroflexota bacterium]
MPTLRELRIARPWSQRELARRAGVAENTIVFAETGQRVPRLLTMRRVADALGVDWSEVAEFREAVAAVEEKEAA